MNLWANTPEKKYLVAGHRGMREGAPENTMMAYKAAIQCGVDMLEIDVHMTKDGQLVLMHDRLVDRTTNGHGAIPDMTADEIRALNANDGYDCVCQVPYFSELCQLMADTPDLLVNIELKDYPHVEGDAFAFESADKVIAMIEEYGIAPRCLLNSFSARLLHHIDKKYGHKYKLHGFYPTDAMFQVEGNPLDYLYCACLWPMNGNEKLPSYPLCPKEYADTLKSRNVQAWVGAMVKTESDLVEAYNRGANVICTNNPMETLEILRRAGLHK